MHQGRFETLAELVDFYNRGGDFTAPIKDPNVSPLGLTDVEKAALVAFLGRPLTDPRVSQADVGGLIRKLEPVDLYRELEALAEAAEIPAEAAGLRFIPEIEEGLVVPGESILLRQAILNLINNAIKFSAEGGFVRLSAARKGDEVHVSVENNEPVISDDDRERIFDRFYRADRARSRGVDGFGLGLSLTRAIVEGHGGKVILEESGTEVTRFVIRLKA